MIYRKGINFVLIIFIILMSSLSGGCSNDQSSSDISDVPEVVENDVDAQPSKSEGVANDNENVEDIQQDSEQSNSEIAIEEKGNIQPVGSPTPDTRLQPEQWKEWEVIPEISQNAMDIYNKGLSLGNDPRAFSKIGDCQAISEVLLGIFDHPDRYSLSDEQTDLKETIDNFQGSFDRDGMAVKGGFNAAAVLSPIWADPDQCLAGETPIECEFRVHKPSIVIISLEVWWEGRTVERYEEYMRQIIDYSIDNGVLPILSTKADNVEKDHSINLATARLAYEYDIPLWNFWRAVQSLPYKGIDPTRDGFHITTDAWTVRSYTALEVLNHVLNKEENQDQEISSQDDVEATDDKDTDDGVHLEPVIIQNEPGDENIRLANGLVVFDIASGKGQVHEEKGIFLLDMETGKLKELLPEGYSLQFISPDGRKFLANQGNRLYVGQLEAPENIDLITEAFYYYGDVGAIWDLEQGAIYYIHSDAEGSSIWRLQDVDDIHEGNQITDDSSNPVEIISSSPSSQLFWRNGTCSGLNECIYENVQAISTIDDPIIIEDYSGYNKPVFSQDGYYIADSLLQQDGKANIKVLKSDGNLEKEIQLPAEHLMDYGWSNGGEKLLVLKLVRSDYSGKSSKIRVFTVQPGNWLTEEYPGVSGLKFKAAWSPAGENIILTGTNLTEAGEYLVDFYLYNTDYKKLSELTDIVSIMSKDYITVNHLYWISDN